MSYHFYLWIEYKPGGDLALAAEGDDRQPVLFVQGLHHGAHRVLRDVLTAKQSRRVRLRVMAIGEYWQSCIRTNNDTTNN